MSGDSRIFLGPVPVDEFAAVRLFRLARTQFRW
jgi:hypothetical protein